MVGSTSWTFGQDNTAMLTNTHNHAHVSLYRRSYSDVFTHKFQSKKYWNEGSCFKNEKQNSKSFFNYDANLTSVITTGTL